MSHTTTLPSQQLRRVNPLPSFRHIIRSARSSPSYSTPSYATTTVPSSSPSSTTRPITLPPAASLTGNKETLNPLSPIDIPKTARCLGRLSAGDIQIPFVLTPSVRSSKLPNVRVCTEERRETHPTMVIHATPNELVEWYRTNVVSRTTIATSMFDEAHCNTRYTFLMTLRRGGRNPVGTQMMELFGKRWVTPNRVRYPKREEKGLQNIIQRTLAKYDNDTPIVVPMTAAATIYFLCVIGKKTLDPTGTSTLAPLLLTPPELQGSII